MLRWNVQIAGKAAYLPTLRPTASAMSTLQCQKGDNLPQFKHDL